SCLFLSYGHPRDLHSFPTRRSSDLTQLYDGITNRGISVWMILHGVTYDIGYLIESSVIFLFERMQNSTLYRFKTIINMRYSTIQNYIGSIIQKPIFIQSRKWDSITCLFVFRR